MNSKIFSIKYYKNILIISGILISILGCAKNQVNSIVNSPNNHPAIISEDTLNSAIGYLIRYETDRKMSLEYGTDSSLTEVYRTYYAKIANLSKEQKLQFFLMVDEKLNVHGESDIFDFYNFVYLYCGDDYTKLLKNNAKNPYFNKELIEKRLDILEDRPAMFAYNAKAENMSLDAYKQKLEQDYLTQIRDFE